ncbi:MAG: hypothetical protein U0136_21070 [Bdellovibrionota bacterium]
MASRLLAVVLFMQLFVALSPNSARADQECRPCPFDCAGIGARSKDCRDLPSRRGQCCVDLDDRGFDQLNRRDEENQDAEVRPSCPPGTTFNGQHCVVNDRSQIRRGGKGTINPCPNPMHYEGGRCVY